MSLERIRIELARDPDFPQGSAKHGYEFVAPLTPDGQLDREEWRRYRKSCIVRRFWEGEDDRYGRLVHHRGDHWAFHYDDMPEPVNEEPIFRFDKHRFVPGEYVSITEHDGTQRTFKVVSVTPALDLE